MSVILSLGNIPCMSLPFSQPSTPSLHRRASEALDSSMRPYRRRRSNGPIAANGYIARNRFANRRGSGRGAQGFTRPRRQIGQYSYGTRTVLPEIKRAS
jgi:hypothetical protein